MLAHELAENLKIVKAFANAKIDNMPMLANVLVEGNQQTLKLTACDGDSGIVKIIENYNGHKVIGEYCINIFKFYDFISAIDKNQDLKINVVKNGINIIGDGFSRLIQTTDPENIYNVPSVSEWEDLRSSFMKELELAIMNDQVDETTPITNQDGYIFAIDTKKLLFIKSTHPELEFATTRTHAKKILISDFTHINVKDNHIHFKDRNTRIFVPKFAGNKFKFLPVLKKADELCTNKYIIKTEDIKYISKLFNSIDDSGYADVPSVVVSFSKDKMFVTSLELEMNCPMICTEGEDSVKIKMPKRHLSLLSKFKTEMITIRLAPNSNNSIYCQSENMIFLGTLLR